MRFRSREQLGMYLLDRMLLYCNNHEERMKATVYAVVATNHLWRKHA